VTLVEYLLGDAHRILLTDCQQGRYDVAPFLDTLRLNGNKDTISFWRCWTKQPDMAWSGMILRQSV
jgi:hypothetical protein